MKIAVCISGHMRNYAERLNSFYENLIGDNDADIFIHTWTTTGHTLQGKTDLETYLREGFDRTKEYIDEQHVRNVYIPKKIIIENYEDVSEYIKVKALEYTNKFHYDNPETLISLSRKIYFCDQLRLQYEKETDTKYDVVVRTRPDLRYDRRIDFAAYDLSVLNTPSEYAYGAISDIFCFSNSKNMEYYSEYFLHMTEVYNKGIKFNPHSMLQAYLEHRNLYYSLHDLGIFLR